MAWIIDPNFGSTHFATTAFSPFVTGGGNRVLSLGAGVVYESSISQKNVDMTCNVVFRTINYSNAGRFGPALIVRRQANGSFYMGTISKEPNYNINAAISLYHYNGISDAFTQLSYVSIGVSAPAPINFEALHSIRFIVNEDSLSIFLSNSSGVVLLSTSTINTLITTAGNPGIGGSLIPSSGVVDTISAIDTLRIGQS